MVLLQIQIPFYLPGELFYIGGNTENAKSTDHVRLLLLLSEQHLSTVLYDPIQKQVFQWGMLELPTDLLQADEAVKAYFETHQLIAENTTKTSLISFTERQSIIPLSLCDTNNISLFAHLLFVQPVPDLAKR